MKGEVETLVENGHAAFLAKSQTAGFLESLERCLVDGVKGDMALEGVKAWIHAAYFDGARVVSEWVLEDDAQEIVGDIVGPEFPDIPAFLQRPQEGDDESKS